MTARLGIIGGYLGSGKSTLVNRLLGAVLPGRTAVVVNDFGRVNIDADLIASASGDTIELTNGCICCQISDDALRTMTALAARGDLDHVLCEVSGVGDPAQLAAWRRFPGFSPGPVLVCADATAVRRLLRDAYVADTVARQLAAAEVVLVTKTDLAAPAELEAAVAACREAAPGARLLVQDPADPGAAATAAFAGPAPAPSVPPADDGAARPCPGAPAAAAGPADDDAPPPDAPAPAAPAPAATAPAAAAPALAAPALAAPDDHARTHGTTAVEDPGPVDVDALARVLADRSGALVRAKGVVRDRDGRWHEVQLAGGRVDRHPRAADRPVPEHPGLVLIAAGPHARQVLDAARSAVLGCAAPPPDATAP
ncbi:GTP-binding protein [Kocuria flava]|uniref:GTP-binding protein n=1 Tax=Kocuria flava TaxID=446860 RepID=UPI001FF0EDF3|nr:GTP-binding protein [Kocuria flava]MCJ8503459.1 GTP-binding protein [Kocuria flava]